MYELLVDREDLVSMPEGAAILLGLLRSEWNYQIQRAECELMDDEDVIENKALLAELRAGWIPFSADAVKKATNMSAQRQTKMLKFLEKAGRVQIKRQGLPGRRWVKIKR